MKNVKLVTLFESPFLNIFGNFAGCIFECIFRCPFLVHVGRLGGQRDPKREVLGELFEDLLGAGSQCENQAPVKAGA